MTDLYYLSQADGVGEWRMKEAKDLSDLVQNRITYLQVPTGPTAARPGVRALPLPSRAPPPCSPAHVPPPVFGCHSRSLASVAVGVSFLQEQVDALVADWCNSGI